MGEKYPQTKEITDAFSKTYVEIGSILHKVSDKKMPAEEKVALLKNAQAKEANTLDGLTALKAKLRDEQ